MFQFLHRFAFFMNFSSLKPETGWCILIVLKEYEGVSITQRNNSAVLGFTRAY